MAQQPGYEEFVAMMHAQNEQCAMALEQRPRNDQALAAWGMGLMQLAMITDDMTAKKAFLRDSREKLNKAVKINPDSVTPDGQLTLFQLASAFYMTFIFEESDDVAEQLLEKSRALMQKGAKKDPTKIDLLQQFNGAWEQRKEVLAAAQRFAGKSKEEQAEEYVKIMEEKLKAAEEMCATLDGKDADALKAVGMTLVDLSLAQESAQDLAGAKHCIHRAVETFRKSVNLSKQPESLVLLAMTLNTRAMGEARHIHHFLFSQPFLLTPSSTCRPRRPYSVRSKAPAS